MKIPWTCFLIQGNLWKITILNLLRNNNFLNDIKREIYKRLILSIFNVYQHDFVIIEPKITSLMHKTRDAITMSTCIPRRKISILSTQKWIYNFSSLEILNFNPANMRRRQFAGIFFQQYRKSATWKNPFSDKIMLNNDTIIFFYE